ncbi:hypothetical protein MCOR27_003028 [Pyricularia oryzae]|uniref:Chromosome transmission fidelity protein 8 n=5 Tax=Pyricularia TaxID=48558 RepID=A0ABQ8P162_PYRGI|nr:uncharacterized protein MGG_03246 [Pyricularia oryzae 70-15]ELQ34520.1 hypothetical protein OOU_Y34scaffold00765g66 [Pyricularia oryzae Y34]KAH8843851.1 hypothetical protein MCOR01_004634 [Pyricularia oryzae]KAI6305061.1 hypothetical protein MCOR33_000178 [Pyricularia grisea]EHA50409.1 hypothetical protein MGG_03246 [Pyricularia oryzae 70-15]KAH9431327.1 hypothetical protein MCOR02_008623 [Pyricularia oryzae]
MSTATLHPRQPLTKPPHNPLPPVLHTPTGLALLELQGSINTGEGSASELTAGAITQVGRLDFPEYVAGKSEDGGSWMKRVYLYVGTNQRLTGEIKKLPRPVAIIRRRRTGDLDDDEVEMQDSGGDELEVVEVVRYKLVFSQRPEPVSTAAS